MERASKKRSTTDAPIKKLRGDKCSPKVPLAKLKNVGGARFTSKTIDTSIPFVQLALSLLDEDPITPGTDLKGVALAVDEAPDAARWGLHLDHMLDTKVLREVPANEAKRERDAGVKRTYCRYKGVHKDELEARAIWDLIMLNIACNPRCVEFTLLGGRAFVAVLRSIPFREKRMRIFHADVSNSYYQLRVGSSLGGRFNIRRGNKILEALVLPMGYTKSCGIAQGVFWGVILRREEGDEDLGAPESVYSATDAPSFIRFASGGVIILIYDSIFVIDTPEGAEAWSHRIRRNMAVANVLLKYAILEGPTTDPDPEKCPMYAGLRFEYDVTGLSWTLQTDSLASWKERVARPLTNTPRTIYKLIGYLRFAYGVLDIHERRLGRWSKIQSLMGSTIASWDEETVDPTHVASLCDAISGMRNGKRHAGSYKADVGLPLRVGYAAGDATTRKYAANLFVDGKPVLPGIVVEFKDEKGRPCERAIEYGEALGQEACVYLLRRRGCNVGIIVGDNQGVGYAFEKGYARNDATDRVIERTVANAGGMAVVIADINTLGNYADIATSEKRSKISDRERKRRERETWACLQRGFDEWARGNAVYVLRT